MATAALRLFILAGLGLQWAEEPCDLYRHFASA